MAPKLTPKIYQILKGENKDMTAIHLDDEFNKFAMALEQFFLIDARYQPAWIDFVKKLGKTLTLTEWGIIVPPLLYLCLSSTWKKQRFVPILIRDFNPLKVTQLCGPFNEKGWVNVINIARKTFLDGQSMSFSDTSHILASLAPHIQVLKSTCSLLKNQAFNNVVLNVTLAALHLLILRLGLLTFGATWQDFLKQVVQDPQSQTLENDFSGDYNSNDWMFPLLASLAISPLVLLRKIPLKDRICGREFLLKDIGFDCPRSLVTVENILWSKLFNIALGRKITREALVEFCEQKKMFFSWEAQAGCLEDNLLSTSLANVITAAHGQGGTDLQETTGPSPPPIPSTTELETNPEGEGDKDEPTDPDKSDDEPMDPEEPDESDKKSKSGSERDKDFSDLESNSTVSDKLNWSNKGTPKSKSTVTDKPNRGDNIDTNEDLVPGDEGQGKDEIPLEAQKRAKMNPDQGILVGSKTQLYDYDWKAFVDFTPISQDEFGLEVFQKAVNLDNITATSDGPIFHSRSILIRNVPHNIYNFNSLSDMEVLLGEETLYSKHTMQDFVLLKNCNSPSFHPNNSHFKATLEELIKSAELRQVIINCLDISIPSTKAPGCQGLATQAEAEGYIRERVDQEGMYWAIAGQKGAYSLLHMDANGLCTVVEPMTRQKYWVIARPKDDVIMNSIDLMDILNVELEDISPFWNFYAVILQPGDIFIMRPATPHYVMTLEDSLCFGSHCYSSQTLTQTALGIYHTLTTGGLIRTNTSHLQTLESLCHISMWWYDLIFYPEDILLKTVANSPGLPLAHKPNFTIIEDVIGFLDLVNLVTLAPVLDVRGYLGGLRADTITLYTEARHLVEEMKVWLFSHFKMGLEDGVDELDNTNRLETLSETHLFHQCQALILQKSKAEEAGIGGEESGRQGSIVDTWLREGTEGEGVPSYSWPNPLSGHYIMRSV
ncbi:hypothetical protein GGU11DRAFT_802492 [Lentinula aff. detonsa]|nr:hypothetical protein GGU11DRAFT_802492 [Lentinula aff. detonsa]